MGQVCSSHLHPFASGGFSEPIRGHVPLPVASAGLRMTTGIKKVTSSFHKKPDVTLLMPYKAQWLPMPYKVSSPESINSHIHGVFQKGVPVDMGTYFYCFCNCEITFARCEIMSSSFSFSLFMCKRKRRKAVNIH